jgi:ribosomal protein L35
VPRRSSHAQDEDQEQREEALPRTLGSGTVKRSQAFKRHILDQEERPSASASLRGASTGRTTTNMGHMAALLAGH